MDVFFLTQEKKIIKRLYVKNLNIDSFFASLLFLISIQDFNCIKMVQLMLQILTCRQISVETSMKILQKINQLVVYLLYDFLADSNRNLCASESLF